MLHFYPKRSGNLDCDLDVSISHTSGRWSIKGDLIANKVCHGWVLATLKSSFTQVSVRQLYLAPNTCDKAFQVKWIHFKLVTDRRFMSPVYVQQFGLKTTTTTKSVRHLPPFQYLRPHRASVHGIRAVKVSRSVVAFFSFLARKCTELKCCILFSSIEAVLSPNKANKITGNISPETRTKFLLLSGP